VNIHDLRDESGYIEAIGRKAAATAVQQARGDVADQERMGEVRVAEAEREKFVLVANATKDREIGLALADRERAVRLAELDKERKVGEQTAVFEREAAVKEAQQLQAVRIAQFDRDQRIGEQTAAFERDAMVKEAEQKKRVAVANADARAIAGEAESTAMIVATQAQLALRQAEAYQLSETKKREAEAAVVEAGNRAQTRAAIADAERVEAEQRAKLEAPAKAEKARMIVDAEASAERVRIQAVAEAGAIYAKLDAQARGEYEVLSKRSEALGQLVEKAGGAREAFQLLMVDQIPIIAESAAKAISNIKFDKVVVWEGGNSNTNSGTANFIQNMAKSMPPMMDVLRTVAGVELPSFLGTMAPDSTTPANTPGNGTTRTTPVRIEAEVSAPVKGDGVKSKP
jgi:flotillin